MSAACRGWPRTPDGRAWQEVFRRLLAAFGPQGWWPAATDEEVVVGAVLTQAVSWRNVERAIQALGRAGLLRLEALAAQSPEAIAPLVRPAGYFRQKARKLVAVARHVVEAGGLAGLARRPAPEARRHLLAAFGIGPETADAILCYALGRPVFVADAYSRRVGERLGLLPRGCDYGAARAAFMAALPADPYVHNELHALLVRLGKEICRPREPRCPDCPLRPLCAAAGGRTGSVPAASGGAAGG